MAIRHKFERTKASCCVNAQPDAFIFVLLICAQWQGADHQALRQLNNLFKE